MEHSNNTATKYRIPIMVALALAIVSLLVVVVNAISTSKQQEDYRMAALAAASVKLEQTTFANELADEFFAANRKKASALSIAYREEFEEAQASASQAAAGTAQAVVIPPAGFRASAYGYTGADNISYWSSINSDVVGWLRVPGTNISHAVVQNTQDVNYYTSRGYDQQYSYYGVIWTNPGTQTGNSSQISSNTVLYGHNWTNYGASPRVGSANDIMFGQLTGYHWLSTAQSYPYIYYSTKSEEMTFKIFACFYTELGFNYNAAEGDMSYIIAEAQRRSRHSFAVDVNSSDKIVTLSTCTRAYGSTNNQRFVVMARLLRPGETISEVTVTSNPNHKQPSVW